MGQINPIAPSRRLSRVNPLLGSSQHGRLVLRLTEGFAQDGVLVLELDARIKTFTNPPLDMLDNLALKQRLNEIGKIAADPHEALRNCPHNCPCELPKQRLQSQRQPNRPIGEVKET